MKSTSSPSVLIIGAGPIGLAMASRLTLANIPFLILEKGRSAGSNILSWGHVNLFTNWKESVDDQSVKLLSNQGIDIKLPNSNPSGADFVNDYLIKLASLIPNDQIHYNSEVKSVQLNDFQTEFLVKYVYQGTTEMIKTKYVFDASGTWQSPNSLVKNQNEYQDYICTGIPDVNFTNSLESGSKIAIVGSGHSAMNSILQLSSRKDLKLIWIIRSSKPRFGLSKVGGKSRNLENEIKSLIDKGALELKGGFQIDKLQIENQKLNIESNNRDFVTGVHKVISNIGSLPNHGLLLNLDLTLDTKYLVPIELAGKINPALHSCDTVSFDFQDTLATESNYFLIGSKTFGKASNFLLSKGYTILDQIIDEIFNKSYN